MDMIEDGSSYFPVEVLTHAGEKKIYKTPEEMPEGVSFRILRTNVEVPKIINTGYPNVWGGVSCE